MEELIRILHQGDYSCVIADNRGNIRTFTRRGVVDLYDLLTDEPEFLEGASVADKVIGKGAASLLILGGVKRLYADIISRPAISLLKESTVEVSFETEVPHIINRQKDGICPVEQLCANCQSAEEALPLIGNFLSKMQL